MELSNISYALLLTTFAGLSTGIGSLIAILSSRTNKRLLSFALGLSAGVMIYVSFMELLSESMETMAGVSGPTEGRLLSLLAFFGGMLLIAAIDKFVPEFENPHEARSVESAADGGEPGLKRVGVMTALVLAIHNFPEGIATMVGTIGNPDTGLVVAAAVAIHNIPEGIAVAIPVLQSTGDRRKAFGISFLSGLAEPVGAIIALVFLMHFVSAALMAVIYAAVAGIMVYVCVDELLPASRLYGEHHLSIYGLMLGMAVMGVSLVVL